MTSPHTKNTLLQAATSQPTRQGLQESIFSSSKIKSKNKKSSHLKKNKTLLTHNPTNKYGMTEQTENIKSMSLEKKEGQLVISRFQTARRA